MRNLFNGIFDNPEVPSEMHSLERVSLSYLKSLIPRAPPALSNNICEIGSVGTPSNDSHASKQAPSGESATSSNNLSQNPTKSTQKDARHLLVIPNYQKANPKLQDRPSISAWLKHLNLYDSLKEFRVTLNKNLLLYPNDLQAKEGILESAKSNNFEVVDNDIKSRQTTFIIKAKFADIRPHAADLKASGIRKIEALISRRTGEQTDLCVAYVEDIAEKELIMKKKCIH